MRPFYSGVHGPNTLTMMQGVSTRSGLLLARQCAHTFMCGPGALTTKALSVRIPWRPVAYYYSTAAQQVGDPSKPILPSNPQALMVHKSNMNMISQQVINGLHDTQDGALRSYVQNKLKKNSQKKLSKDSNLPIKDTIISAGYDEDDVVIDFEPEMLDYLIITKRKEGWTTQECANAINLITSEWGLPRTIHFFGQFYKRHVDVYAHENEGKAKPGKMTGAEMGDLMGLSMKGRDYAYMVDLMIKTVIGEGSHTSLLESVKDSRDATHHFKTIANMYAFTLAHFSKWEFPYIGTVLRELANVPPKFAKHYYPWYTQELTEDFGVEILSSTAVEFRKIRRTKLLNPRLIENWEQTTKDNFKKKLYTKLDGDDNPLTFYAYKLLRFLRLKQPKIIIPK